MAGDLDHLNDRDLVRAYEAATAAEDEEAQQRYSDEMKRRGIDY